jgi:hypothetical protein
MEKKVIVEQALEFCANRSNADVSIEDFKKLLDVIEKFYQTKNNNE